MTLADQIAERLKHAGGESPAAFNLAADILEYAREVADRGFSTGTDAGSEIDIAVVSLRVRANKAAEGTHNIEKHLIDGIFTPRIKTESQLERARRHHDNQKALADKATLEEQFWERIAKIERRLQHLELRPHLDGDPFVGGGPE